jgi:hypothetical protein
MARSAVFAFVIGMGVWGLKMWRLSACYRDEAATFAELELEAKLSYCSRDINFAALDRKYQISSINAEAGSARAIEWLGQMRQRYQYAASHPWESLSPVPTPPE